MKKFTKIAAFVAAAGVAAVFTGCAGSCAGCGGSTVTNSALTNSNWYTQTGYKGIQPYFIEGNADFSKEILTYDVSFEPAFNGFYKVEYGESSYKTCFYAIEYDWNGEKIPENYKTEKKETVYYYETEFKTKVKFSKGTDEVEFNDSIKTVSVFRSAYYSLQPVYSRQEMSVTSPAKQNPSSLDEAYKHYDVTYENHYNYQCTEVTTAKTEGGETETATHGKLNKTSHTLFDNSALYTVIRSMKLSDSLSQTVDLFIPQEGGIKTEKLNGSSEKLSETELEQVTEALVAAKLYEKKPTTTDDEGNEIKDGGVPTVAVKIGYDGGEMSGTTQTVWYAALNDPDNNTARCTMVKLALPLTFGLGTLNFTLSKVESTLWNG